MSRNIYNTTLALAGICQSARLVQQLAHQGSCDQQALKISLQSLLDLNPPSILAVYGNDEANLRLGFESLLATFNTANRKTLCAELMKYTLSLIMLERRLNKTSTAQNSLAQRLTQLDRQLLHYQIDADPVISAMAAVYVDIISPLGPRIQVTGSPALLQNSLIQQKIRAALLAGIRSAVLWQQTGGSRWQLMFFRKGLSEEAKKQLHKIGTHN